MSALGRITRGRHITYDSLMFFIAHTFKGQVNVIQTLPILSDPGCHVWTDYWLYWNLRTRSSSAVNV